jgi:heat shock protein HtpX
VPLSIPLLFLVALAPALVAWWTGRGILARVDDPALPEMLLERRRRMNKITLIGIVILAVLAGSALVWALPLLWIALLVSGYPVRRTLFAERWNLFAFLRYAISSGIGQAGWQLLGAFGPVIATTSALGAAPEGGGAAMRIALWVGGYLATVTMLWQHFYPRVWLDLHRAAPLRASARPELVARIDAVLDRATPPRRPEVYRFGVPGGHFVNALAIPSLTAPAVALSDGLLAALTDDEIVGVFAHEVAHHEQFTRRRLWIGRIAGILIALLNLGLPIGFILLGPGMAALGAAAYCILIFTAVARSAGSRQANETASDLRAAALTGDPEAMASALTKLHLLNRVPRRWPHALESAATHPSLARRIQALRAAAPVSPMAAGPLPLAIVRSSRGNAVVALESARAHWFEGVPADTTLDLAALRGAASSYRAAVYSDLTELRIGTAGHERTLTAVDRRGHAWSIPIAAADVGPLQAALDAVDVKLGPRPATLQPVGMATARLLVIAALIALTVSGEAGVVLVPVLFVLFRPALTAAVAAAGTITLGRAFAASMNLPWLDTSRQMGVAGAVAAGIALTVVAIVRVRAEGRREGGSRRPPREAWLMMILLGCLAGMLLMPVISIALARPASVVSNPFAVSAAMTLAGIAAALATMSGRWRRLGGGLASAIALTGGTLLSGEGALYNRSASIVWTKANLVAEGSVAIAGGSATSLEVSPTGESYAVAQFRPARRSGASGNRYFIGRFGAGTPRVSDALQVVPLDDETVLALDLRGTDSLELRAEGVAADSSGAARVRWRQVIRASELPRLLVDRPRHAWIVLGRVEGDREIVVTTDTIGGRRPRSYRWSGPSSQDLGELTGQPLVAFEDGSAISLALSPTPNAAGGVATTLLLMASQQWELRRIGSSGERLLADIDGVPTCGSELDAHGVICAERSPSRTRLWRIGAATAEPAGDLPASLQAVHPLGAGRVAAVERFGSRLAVVDLGSGRALRLTLPADDPRTGTNARWTSDVVATGDYVVVLSNGRASTMVRRYRIR